MLEVGSAALEVGGCSPGVEHGVLWIAGGGVAEGETVLVPAQPSVDDDAGRRRDPPGHRAEAHRVRSVGSLWFMTALA